MAADQSGSTWQTGRFDKSFVVRMVRDFFVSLLLLMGLEIGFRYLLTLYQFERDGRRQSVQAAEQLAGDVRAIMINRGGPVASRTVYPILRRNYRELGLAIAIVPSPVTVDSIDKRFDFQARGLAPKWPEGDHYWSHRVTLEAEAFCLQCHTEAAIGDPLGHVEVRSYFSDFRERWWEEARMTSLTGMVNIIFNTIILYLLLKFRMGPLLALRQVLDRLVKGGMDLSRRAQVRSEDEFGELALDLNLFLDRICRLHEELEDFAAREVLLNRELQGMLGQVDEGLEAAWKRTHATLEQVLADLEQLLAPEETSALAEVLAELDGDRQQLPPAARHRLQDALSHHRNMLERVRQLVRRYRQTGQSLLAVDGELRRVQRQLRDLRVLEDRMNQITEAGQRLLERLTVRPEQE